MSRASAISFRCISAHAGSRSARWSGVIRIGTTMHDLGAAPCFAMKRATACSSVSPCATSSTCGTAAALPRSSRAMRRAIVTTALPMPQAALQDRWLRECGRSSTGYAPASTRRRYREYSTAPRDRPAEFRGSRRQRSTACTDSASVSQGVGLASKPPDLLPLLKLKTT